MSIIETATLLLRNVLRGKVDAAHGINHARAVLHHANKALEYESISKKNGLNVQLASLLHDADDSKFFKNSTNASNILVQLNIPKHDRIVILHMIDQVSCSKNKNNLPTSIDGVLQADRFHLIPRWCDRLEAMGEIGCSRTMVYSEARNRLDFVHDTCLPLTLEDLYKAASIERFNTYKKSKSFLDHYYDKILHLKVNTNNPYLDKEMAYRHEWDIQFVLKYSMLISNQKNNMKVCVEN